MTEHTHDKTHWATITGRLVVFMARPGRTKQKKYREPVMIKKKRYETKADAEIAAKQWEGILA